MVYIGIVFCLFLSLGASVDRRRYATKPVFKYEVDTITVPNGDANEWTGTIPNINGVIRQVTVNLNNNTNGVTTTIEIRDSAGAILWTETGITENQIAVFQYNTRSGTDLPMAVMCAETITIGITPSGDPGVSTLTADVVVWGL
jgi:hypothetical protein